MFKLARAATTAALMVCAAAAPLSSSATASQPARVEAVSKAAHAASDDLDPVTTRILSKVRAETAKYRKPAGALRAGFVEGPVDAGKCVTRDGGVRGYHYSNMDLMKGELDLNKPAVLIYQPVGPDGSLRLVAVEWFSLDKDGDPATDDDRPSVGSQPFVGPIADIPNVPVHYYAIAWIGQDNPRGMFADTNPAGTCEPKKSR